ncbi:MAG: pyrroline-5-carboxylate reductase [Thiofilum sp.]|uniref:pyrroline-5-carboxylate reductase n=1 Tax=Thiofilum sp. TaxID=2212733 RepID=UPI0025ED6CB8|nr:pyrroline-5-carboxylate reductase [Thiofilum sp.]MBK8452293.1 pyrroline-5-carboxylate reductase [Thiofilum sp.]
MHNSSTATMDDPQLSQKKLTIAFIGSGNMARSLILGLLNDNSSPLEIRVSDPDPNQLTAMRQHWPEIKISTSNDEVALGADIVVLAVKPQIMREVAQTLAATCQTTRPLVVSVAAGIKIDALQQWLGGQLPIVRCMPNTPALVQAGATGLYANELVNTTQRNQAESILRSVGITLWFEQEQALDAVTATSGSGPAYFFLVMEAMQAAAQSLGLPAQEAHLLVVQTALGAAKLALESQESPAELRRKVTSKGGTTAAALEVLQGKQLETIFLEAMQAAAKRSETLAAENS